MAGKRIPDLDPLSGAASANDDKLVIYDSSTTSTKRIDRSQLAAGLVGDLPYTPSGSISATTIPTAIAELDSEAAKSAALAASGGAALIGNTPAGTIAATTVQGAINEIVSDLAASSGSSLVGHIGTGTGAVARTVQSKLRDVVNVADFGIIGGVDETSKLENLRQYAIANPGTYFDFRNIPTKELRYTTPKWMAEIQDATFDLRGISLRNLGAGTYSYSDMDAALVVGSGAYFHDDQGTGQINPAKANSGHLIQDANSGASSVTLVTTGDAANYSVGDRVLLRWMERQGAASFPPNPGYFEWHTIKTIVGGVVTFEKPLKYIYKAQAPDFTSGSFYLVTNGKARILNLTRSGYTEAGTLRILGGIGVDTGAGTAGYRGALIVEGAALVEVEDANFKAYFNNCSEKQILRRCIFSGGITELDKIVGTLVAEDTNFNGMSQGTGVEVFEMNGGILTGAVQIRTREIYLNKVQVRTTNNSGNVMISMDAWPRRLVQVKDCEFVAPSASTSAVQVGNVTSFTPDAITSTQITVNATNPAYTQVVQNLEEGQVTTLNNGKPPQHFYVTGFSFDGSNNLLIAGYCEVASPSGGARILWFAKNFRHSGNTFYNAGVRFRLLMSSRRVWHVDSGTEGKVRVTQIMQYGQYTTLAANCYVESVTVDVVKPYTGTDASCTLDVSTEGAGTPQAYMTINGLTAGRRMRNQAGGYGAQAGDTLTAFANLAWSEDIVLHLRGTGGTGIFTDGALSALPLIRVVIEGYKPPFDKQEL